MISKKIILVVPPYKESKKGHLPLLSIGYLAAYLEKGGYNVKIIDAIALDIDAEKTVETILKEEPAAVGITTVSSSRFSAIKIIRLLKQKNKELFIFVGGRHFNSVWRESLRDIPEIDVIVRGEGEITSLKLLNGYFSGENFSQIKGIAFRSGNGNVVFTPQRESAELDSLPMPAWHLFDLSKYKTTLEGERQTKAIGVISSRGCPNECVFCANNSFEKTLRLRNPKNFVDEIEFLKNTYGYNGFDIWDDTLTMSKKHILGICEEIIKRKLNIIWYARARVNTVDEEILKKMKAAGCRIIGFGIESGSERILKEIKKYITIAQIKKAVYLSAKLGFITKCWFIHGFPSETLDDVRKTKDLMRQLKNYGGLFGSTVMNFANFPILYPGTPMTEQSFREGIIPKEFSWTKEIFFERNKKFGLDSVIPIYESKNLPIEAVLEFNKNYNRRFLNLLQEFFYQLRQIRDWRSSRLFLKRFLRFFQDKL